jgi:hypothetical protein
MTQTQNYTLLTGIQVPPDGRGSSTSAERRRMAAGRVTTEGIAAGTYTISVIVKNGPLPVGKVSRALAVTGP